MSDMTHSDAEEALVSGDKEDVNEALAAEQAEEEAAPEEAAVHPDAVADLVEEVTAEEEAELEAVVEEAVIEEIVEEIVEEAVLEAVEEAVVEEIAEEIAEEVAAATPSAEPDLVLDATDGADAEGEDGDLGGWVKDDEEDEEPLPVESPYDRPGRWYVVHTYSGYENKVRSNMGNVVASRGIEDRVV